MHPGWVQTKPAKRKCTTEKKPAAKGGAAAASPSVPAAVGSPAETSEAAAVLRGAGMAHQQGHVSKAQAQMPRGQEQQVLAVQTQTQRQFRAPGVTTFRTRSRTETQALQAEANVTKRKKTRYVPPGRPVLQCFAAPTVPPRAPLDVADASVHPIIRIGDTFELKFALQTPFDLMCLGDQIEPNGQTALGFRCTDSGKAAAAVVSLEFQIFYYSFDGGMVCLRCQKAPSACACNYASDVLEISQYSGKAKRDSQRRLGLKGHSDGTCSIGVRVPRARRKVSKADKEAGVQQSDRPTSWNSKLRQLSSKDPN